MRKRRWFFLNLDGGSPYILPVEPLALHTHLFSQISSFVDNSLHQSRFLYIHGSTAFHEALNCLSTFTGSLFLWLSCQTASNVNRNIPHELKGSNSKHGSLNPTQVKNITSCRHNLMGCDFDFTSEGESASPVDFGKILNFAMRYLQREAEKLQSFPLLSLAAAVVPPFGNISSNVLALPLEDADMRIHGCTDQRPCQLEQQGCAGLGLSFPDLNWTSHAVEAKTGIKFPMILDDIVAEKNYSNLSSEDCSACLKSCSPSTACFVPRSANEAAHSLAKWASASAYIGNISLDNIPAVVRQALRADDPLMSL